jgi:hypothetical protein
MHGIILPTHTNNRGGSLQALTNGIRDGGLADAGGAGEQDDHALLGVHALVLSDELKDTLLRLAHPVVALLQHVPGVGHVPEGLHPGVPREAEHMVQVGYLSR